MEKIFTNSTITLKQKYMEKKKDHLARKIVQDVERIKRINSK